MTVYTSISIIFNPNSTGNGKQLATDLRDTLREKDTKLPIKLIPTKHAGHAETLAYELAMGSEKPLIISSSGDGGYHEVINGIMRAQHNGAHAVAGLLPAGNANDHYHNIHTPNIANSIITHKEKKIDLLTLKTSSNKKTFERYAHSYIGIGLTPKVGRGLNKTDLNWFNEILIAIKVLFFLRPVRISVAGKTTSYDSLLFSNIDKMAKVLKLSKNTSTSDGKFEVTAFKRRSKLKLIKELIRSSTVGLNGEKQLSEYTFTTLKPLLIQLDGEIATIDAHSPVEIGIERRALTCIV
jgi:diacylglycerol kinase (ATP)